MIRKCAGQRGWTGQFSPERGSMLPLVAGAMALALAVSMAVVSATSLTIERHRLVALAEATALRGAESFDPARLRRSGDGVVVPLESGRVADAALEFLRGVPEVSHRELRLIRADTPDGSRARVVLEATWYAPLWSEFLPLSLPIEAEALSRSVIR